MDRSPPMALDTKRLSPTQPGLPPSGLPVTPADTRQAVVAAVAGTCNDTCSSDQLVHDLCSCCVGGELHLNTLGPEALKLAYQLPSTAWAALDHHLTATSNGVTSMTVPIGLGTFKWNGNLFGALSALPALQRMTVQLPGDRPEDKALLLDLGSLRAPQLQQIFIQPPSGAVSRVALTLREGVHAQAIDITHAALYKSTVQYVDDDLRPQGRPMALAGAPYFATGHDPELTYNDGQTIFNVGPDELALHNPVIMCRQLATMWGDLRHEYRQAKLDSESPVKAGKFVPLKMLTRQSIADNMPMDVESRHQASLQAGPVAVFDPPSFGLALYRVSESMAPGSSHIFDVVTDNHVMELELHVKEKDGRRQCVAAYEDPNSTLPHTRTVITKESSGALGLQGFLLDGKRVGTYQDATPAVCALYARLRIDAKSSGGRLVESKGGEHLVDIVTAQGVPPSRVAQWFIGMDTAQSRDITQNVLDKSLNESDIRNLSVGLRDAMNAGLPGVGVYLQQVLGSTTLDEPTRVRLLSGVQESKAEPKPGQERVLAGSTLRSALRMGHAGVAQAFGRAVARAASLDSKSQMALLLAHSETSGAWRDKSQVTALHDICKRSKMWHLDPALADKQHRAIHAFVTEVMQSPKLTDAQKRRICSEGDNLHSPAKMAIDTKNPGACAAIVCAVLENNGSLEWLQHNGQPSHNEIISILDKDLESNWSIKLRQALEAKGIDTKAHVEPPHPLTGQQVIAAGADPRRCQEANLQVIRRAGGKLFCASTEVIAGLPRVGAVSIEGATPEEIEQLGYSSLNVYYSIPETDVQQRLATPTTTQQDETGGISTRPSKRIKLDD